MANQNLEVPRGLAQTLPREHSSLLGSLVGRTNEVSAEITAAIAAAGIPVAASQAQAEAGTDTAAYISAAIAAFLPAMPKAMVLFDASSGSPVSSLAYNISSITDRGVGLFTINFTRAFSSTEIGMFGTAGNGAANFLMLPDLSVAVTTSSFSIQIVSRGAGAATDTAYNFCAFFGDLT